RTFNFTGAIDEVEVFNRALSGSEIAAIFNAGSYGKCQPIYHVLAGTNVTAQPAILGSSDTTTMTFANVSSAGDTVATQFDLALAGALPAGFGATSPSLAFDLSTSAVFSGSVQVC